MGGVVRLAVVIALVGCESSPGAPDETGGGTGEPTTTSGSPSTTMPGDGSDDDSAPGTTGGTTDADASGESGAHGSSTGEAEGRVPMFVAQGNIGRTVISCDDGHTWVADRAWDMEDDPLVCGQTDVRCFEQPCTYLSNGECAESAPECDCGHHPGFAKGIAFGNGYFVATWGWGHSGSVRRSADGVVWEETLGEDVTFGGIAFGADRFVLSNRYPMYSTDGSNWTAGQEADFRGPGGEIVWSVRRFGYADHDGGRFIATANPPQAILISSDGGENWWPPTVPDGCLADVGTYGGMAYGDGVFVGVGDSGTFCRTTNGGDSWTIGSVGGDSVYARVLWTGEEFVTWAPGVRYTSPDGETWSSTPTTPDGIWVGPAAVSEATGSFVANTRVWDGYENQTMMRSDDGVNWEILASDAFAGGHPIFEMAFGWAEPSALCPAP